MKPLFLDYFHHPSEPRQRVRYGGNVYGDGILNGKILAGQSQIGSLVEGVLSFGDTEDPWPRQTVQEMKRSGQISRSWQRALKESKRLPLLRQMHEEMARTDGVLLEVAAGPGGGGVPAILSLDPEHQIIMNDVSPGILGLWREFLQTKRIGQNVCFAAFDSRVKVLRPGCLRAVSSHSGFGNIEHGNLAIREVCLALAPGGRIFSWELVLRQDEWLKIPEETRSGWEQAFPVLSRGSRTLLEQAGLSIEDHQIVPGRKMIPEEDGVAGMASAHGVALYCMFEFTRAVKPKEDSDG